MFRQVIVKHSKEFIYIGLATIVYTSLWLGFFALRVLTTMSNYEGSYAMASVQASLCNATEISITFSEACDKARFRVSKSLWRESLTYTWEQSTLCGGNSCFVAIFGKDETFMGILLRLAIVVFVTLSVGLLFVIVVDKFDTFVKVRHVKPKHASSMLGLLPTFDIKRLYPTGDSSHPKKTN